MHKENNYTLTGISYEGNLTTDTEITLTFANDVCTSLYNPVDADTDIAFWFDSNKTLSFVEVSPSTEIIL